MCVRKSNAQPGSQRGSGVSQKLEKLSDAIRPVVPFAPWQIVRILFSELSKKKCH